LTWLFPYDPALSTWVGGAPKLVSSTHDKLGAAGHWNKPQLSSSASQEIGLSLRITTRFEKAWAIKASKVRLIEGVLRS
jgi:hypothetical protein